MARFLLSRLLQAFFVIAIVACLAFVVFRYVGDPVDAMITERATPEERQQLRENLGLDQSAMVQFASYLKNVATGHLGYSYRNQEPVLRLLASRAPATIELVFVATFLSLLAGIPLGVYAAVHRGKPMSHVVQTFSVVGISVPPFANGILLILVFSVSLGVLPSFGRGEVTQLGMWSTGLLSVSGWKAIILPSISLALYQLTFVLRLVRAEMIEVLHTDYVKFAHARGLPIRLIHYRYALRNALLPVITLTGMQIGTLIAFAIVTETVFQWPGLGLLLLQSIAVADTPVLSAYLLFTGLLFTVINIVIDVIYSLVDPRISVG